MFWTEAFFSSGPFARASIDSQNFADGLYFAHLFQSSLEQRNLIEEAHLSATMNNDLELALKKKIELDYLDGIFKLTMEIHKSDGGLDS
jgi:hypothetical protein